MDPGKIADLRARLRLTQPEFGKLIGVDKNTICGWEKGRTRPGGKYKRRLDLLEKDLLERREKLLEMPPQPGEQALLTGSLQHFAGPGPVAESEPEEIDSIEAFYILRRGSGPPEKVEPDKLKKILRMI